LPLIQAYLSAVSFGLSFVFAGRRIWPALIYNLFLCMRSSSSKSVRARLLWNRDAWMDRSSLAASPCYWS
jgi:hypothetical protein